MVGSSLNKLHIVIIVLCDATNAARHKAQISDFDISGGLIIYFDGSENVLRQIV